MEILDIARHQEHIMFGLSRLASRVAREMLSIENHDRAQTVARVAREMLLIENHDRAQTVAYVREISQTLYLYHSKDRFAKRNTLERLHADDRVMRNNAIESLLNQLRYLVQEFKLYFGRIATFRILRYSEYQATARLIGSFVRVKEMEYNEDKRQLWDKPFQHQVIAEISPCLNAIKSIVTQLITGLNGLDDETATKLHLFLDTRDMICDAVQEPIITAESGQFLLSLSPEFFGPLFQSLDIMTEAMVLTTGTLMKSLWRHLHPSVLASQELVQVEEELLNIALSIDV
ncbi:hypothetical protein EC968_009330 [Mortierella alpina]|nr:hypothetical protein EC968_009330 [Mortierella alpina]